MVASNAYRSLRTGRSHEVTLEVLTAVRGSVAGSRSIPRRRRQPGRHRSTRTRSTQRTNPNRSRRISQLRRRQRSSSQRFRAPYRGRSTPVNAWWGSFDLAVSLFSGQPVEPPSADFIMRNAGNAEQVEVGWWPGDARYPKAAFFAYATRPGGVRRRDADALRCAVGACPRRVRARLGRRPSRPEPARGSTRIARSAVRHACAVCRLGPDLSASAEGIPPPVA